MFKHKHLGRIKDWNRQLQILLIKMVSVEHDSAAGTFTARPVEQLNHIRPKLAHKLDICGSGNVQGSYSSKETSQEISRQDDPTSGQA